MEPGIRNKPHICIAFIADRVVFHMRTRNTFEIFFLISSRLNASGEPDHGDSIANYFKESKRFSDTTGWCIGIDRNHSNDDKNWSDIDLLILGLIVGEINEMSKIGNEPRIFIESGRWKPREVITLLIVESNHFILFILELFYLGPSNTVSRFFAEGHGSLQAKSNMKQLSYIVKGVSINYVGKIFPIFGPPAPP